MFLFQKKIKNKDRELNMRQYSSSHFFRKKFQLNNKIFLNLKTFNFIYYLIKNKKSCKKDDIKWKYQICNIICKLQSRGVKKIWVAKIYICLSGVFTYYLGEGVH